MTVALRPPARTPPPSRNSGGDIYGDGVNIAARLEALAEPGGVCISRTVRDHIGERLPYAFDDVGEQNVKNILSRCTPTR